VEDWVEVRLSPAPAANECYLWTIELDRSGRVVDQTPLAEIDP
jgi:hypothetical protein